MTQKQCGKCGEMVEQAKAFCPGCGHAFVEEESREATNFERMDSTVQLGQTMYNQMLSDMGLSKEKDASLTPEKRIEVIEPIAAAGQKPQTVPAADAPRAGSSVTKWIIAAAVILFIGLLALVAAGVLLYFFWPRAA